MESDLELLKNSVSDLMWLKENAGSIRQKYEGKIIAINRKSVVAFAPSVDLLFAELQTKGIEESKVIIRYVSPANQITIF